MPSEVVSVVYDGIRYALIVRDPRPVGRVQFFTPDDSPLQVGAFAMKKGEEIPPHIHRECERRLTSTSEVLMVQAGTLEVDFYDDAKNRLGSQTLKAGDVIVLFEGGHGFRVSEDLRMLEIKQGPYVGERDKIRFDRPL